jgi:hypothetical protein
VDASCYAVLCCAVLGWVNVRLSNCLCVVGLILFATLYSKENLVNIVAIIHWTPRLLHKNPSSSKTSLDPPSNLQVTTLSRHPADRDSHRRRHNHDHDASVLRHRQQCVFRSDHHHHKVQTLTLPSPFPPLLLHSQHAAQTPTRRSHSLFRLGYATHLTATAHSDAALRQAG